MFVPQPPALFPIKLHPARPNRQKYTCPHSLPGADGSPASDLRKAPRSPENHLMSVLYQDDVWNVTDRPASATGQAAVTPNEAAHRWFDEFGQIRRRRGFGAISALRRFHREEGFKKIVFLYERSQYLYENKEVHVKNEAKTKLKTCCFLAKTARKNPIFGWLLAKQTQETCPRRLGTTQREQGTASREDVDSASMINRGNEAKKWLKTKDITFFSGANRAHFTRKFAPTER